MLSPIPGYENRYYISDTGHIYSEFSGRFLSPSKNPAGYMIACLCKYGKPRGFQVHRLVAKAFIDNPKSKPQVNHIDGCKDNNHADNLEWVTAKINSSHFKKGFDPKRGMRKRRLTDEEINEVKILYANGMIQRKIGEKYGVGQKYISRVLSR